MNRTCVKALLNAIFVHRILIKCYKNIRYNHGKMSRISLKMSGRIREFFSCNTSDNPDRFWGNYFFAWKCILLQVHCYWWCSSISLNKLACLVHRIWSVTPEIGSAVLMNRIHFENELLNSVGTHQLLEFNGKPFFGRFHGWNFTGAHSISEISLRIQHGPIFYKNEFLIFNRDPFIVRIKCCNSIDTHSEWEWIAKIQWGSIHCEK